MDIASRGAPNISLRLDMDAKPGPALTFGNGGARTLTDVEWDRGIFDATVVADLPLPAIGAEAMS